MKQLDFFYDFSSPYAYFASCQVEDVARTSGAALRWRPFYLGALFKQIGTPTVPIASFPAPKQAYLRRDFLHVARYLGVPFQHPTRFPMITVHALRLVMAAPAGAHVRLARALFTAYWVDDRDLADHDELASIAGALGLDSVALLAASVTPDNKAALVAATQAAVDAGVCGAPSFLVRSEGGDELFWGQDRLPLVERALGGSKSR